MGGCCPRKEGVTLPTVLWGSLVLATVSEEAGCELSGKCSTLSSVSGSLGGVKFALESEGKPNDPDGV